jgi:hypothetical protein
MPKIHVTLDYSTFGGRDYPLVYAVMPANLPAQAHREEDDYAVPALFCELEFAENFIDSLTCSCGCEWKAEPQLLDPLVPLE